MLFSKLTYPLLIAGFISTSSFAANIESTIPWGLISEDSAGVLFTPNFSNRTIIFNSIISHSVSGNQRIYFELTNLDDSDICSYESKYPDDDTMVFSGQAVKMLRWCKLSSDGSYYFYSYTPDTNRGHSYVVNLFKRATKPIKIRIDGDVIDFPVMGFTKAWNSAGGNAI